MEAFSRLGLVLVGTRAFGEGDSYIAAGIGAVFGSFMGCSGIYQNFLPILQALLAILILSAGIQIIITLPLFIKKLIKNKNWLTIGALSVFIIYTIGYVFAQQAEWFTHPIAYWSSTIVLVIIGLLTCRELICGLKRKYGTGNVSSIWTCNDYRKLHCYVYNCVLENYNKNKFLPGRHGVFISSASEFGCIKMGGKTVQLTAERANRGRKR